MGLPPLCFSPILVGLRNPRHDTQIVMGHELRFLQRSLAYPIKRATPYALSNRLPRPSAGAADGPGLTPPLPVGRLLPPQIDLERGCARVGGRPRARNLLTRSAPDGLGGARAMAGLWTLVSLR
jgi:hypothetical protein